MNNTIRVPLIMRIPPPLLFVATFLAGVGLQHVVPLNAGASAGLVNAEHVAGIVAIALGALLAFSCLAMFLFARTTVIPFSTAATLVTWGPYRLTRNPMYVSLVLVYLGVAAALAQLWPLLLLPLPWLVVHAVVIPFEESRLREVFGETFEQYCARVRRWL